MYIHKEGYRIIAFTMLLAIVIISAMNYFIDRWDWYWYSITALIVIVAFIVIRFFRIPIRELVHNEDQLIGSADGTIVVVEQQNRIDTRRSIVDVRIE